MEGKFPPSGFISSFGKNRALHIFWLHFQLIDLYGCFPVLVIWYDISFYGAKRIKLETLENTTATAPEKAGKGILPGSTHTKKKQMQSVLIYDNDEMSRLLIGYILESNFIPYRVAGNIAEAKEKLEHENFGLLIVAVNDAESMDPYLAGLTKRKLPPVIALIWGNEKTRYTERGFNGVLSMPYSEEDLIELIFTYMKNDTNDHQKEGKLSSNGKTDSFSLEQLKRIGNNDKEFILRMLEKFVQSAHECGESLTAALPQNDWNKLRTAAHKSIPSYSLMGLNNLVSELELIEARAGQQHYAAEMQQLVRSVEEQNRKIILEARNCIERLKQNPDN